MFRFISPLILIIISVSIFSSCLHPEEPEDTTPPEISVISPIENRVKGLITIAARVEETGTGLSMQVFLDGNLLKSSSTGQISTEVDTQTLTEGSHTIRITATDAAGNTSEKIIMINVRNILFKAHVSSNYIPESTRIYFALSKNDGSLIAFHEIENNGTMSVPTPIDFNLDSTFVLTEYFYLSQEGFQVRTINVSAGLQAGEFFLPDYGSSLPVKGINHLKITDLPTEYNNVGMQGKNIIYGSNYSAGDGIIETDLNMSSSTSDLFFSMSVGTEAPVYNYISNIQEGGSTQFSATGLPHMQGTDVTTADMTGNYGSYVFSTNNSSAYIFSAEGFFEDGKIPVYYPAASYPQYVFDLRYQNGNNSFSNLVKRATPPNSFQYVNAAVSNVTYANQKVKVTSTGNYDIVSLTGSTSNFENFPFSLDIYSVTFPNAASNQVTITNTPASLLSLGFAPAGNYILNSVGFTDFLALSGSSDYQNKIIFVTDNVLRQQRDQIFKASQITPNGRLSSQKKMKLPKQVETILKNRFYLNDFQ